MEDKHIVLLTDEQMERLAEKAAEKALAKVYTEVGRSIVTKFLWLVGAAFLGWATATGKLPLPPLK
jgi:diaminopimelate decarboxylase